jgi:PAS domain S-box-containing protein
MNPTPSSTAALEPTSDRALDRTLVTAFLENIPDNVYFKDRDSRFIAVSASMFKYHGFPGADELIGKTDFDLFDHAHAQPARQDEETIVNTGVPIIGKLEKETWADGHVTWVLTSKMPLRDEQGAIIGTFGISKDITKTKETEFALEKAQRQLVDASRLAGMAEVATGVLHNVGNVLNSLNVSASVIATGLRQSKSESLVKISELFHERRADLGEFLLNDPKGRRLPDLLASLAQHSVAERDRLLEELDSLQKNIDHIKEIVAMQQTYATMVGIVEPLSAEELMEDSLRMNAGALVRHAVRVIREFHTVSPILGEKGKVLQILVNLIRNAKYAADDGGSPDKTVTLRIERGAPGRVLLTVQDNGVGIPAENLTRIFSHGFTTRENGHGFGLHSSANAAREMKGSLSAYSDGPGLGARFVLDLPEAPSAASA